MTFSTRYAVPMALAAALALLPVAIHGYARVRVDDCRNPVALTPGGDAEPKTRRDAWLRERYEAFAWREGEISSRDGRLRYVIARSFDPKRVYYRSGHQFALGAEAEGTRLHWIDLRGEHLPVIETLYAPPGPGKPRQIAYHLLISEGEAVASPIRHQLVSIPRAMIAGRRPMTLIYVDTVALDADAEKARAFVLDWLAGAYQNYLAVCS